MSPETIIDAHVHIWEISQERYHFDPAFGTPPSQEAGLDDLLALMDRHGVARAALIQPGNYGFDAGLIADIVARYPQRFIGLGMVDPTQPDVADRLSMWVEERGLVGMRVLGRWVDAPYMETYWRRAAELQASLSFITGAIDLAPLAHLLDRLPATPVVIDHLGHRRFSDRAHCQQLLDLARYPHVYVKWSGLYATSAEPFPHHDADWFLQATLEAFGPKRLLWASDFPYIVATDGYGPSLDLCRRGLSFMTDDDRAWVCGKAAATLWPAS
jgi:L-fuconolactonase